MSRPAGSAPTMADVAERAGVSRALVSIVFRDQPGAGEATRRRVREAAAAIGYAPDQRARLLSRSRSGLVGVVFGLGHEFHSDLVEALYAAAAPAGFEVALGGFAPSRDEEHAVAGLLAYRCEALVLLGSGLAPERLAALAGQVPVVAVARRLEVAGVDVVRTDDVAGARLATEHLLAAGHEEVAFLAGGRVAGDAERRRGYRAAMRAAGLRDRARVRVAGLTEEAGATAIDRLLGPGRRAAGTTPGRATTPTTPTALVAFNDRCALGALTRLRQRGVTVPEEVSVVGYDDTRVARLPWADLTTVHQDTVAIAGRAVALARARAEGAAAGPEVVVAPSLVVRGSTGPAPATGAVTATAR